MPTMPHAALAVAPMPPPGHAAAMPMHVTLHPGIWAGLAAGVKGLYLAALSAVAGLTIFATEVSGAERAAWIVTVGGGVFFVLSKLGDWAVKLKRDWMAADAGTVQAELQTVKDRLAEAESRQRAHMGFAAEAIARGDAAQRQLEHQQRQIEELTKINGELIDALREAQRDLSLASARAGQTTQMLAEKMPAAPPPAPAPASEPVKVVIAPESEPVPVREVDGGGLPC